MTRSVSCGCPAPTPDSRKRKWAPLGGIFAALGLCAACCLVPVIVLSFGTATAWAGTLDAFSPYKWALAAVTAGLLGYGFYSSYRKTPTGCTSNSCSVRRKVRAVRIGLWSAAILATAALLLP